MFEIKAKAVEIPKIFLPNKIVLHVIKIKAEIIYMYSSNIQNVCVPKCSLVCSLFLKIITQVYSICLTCPNGELLVVEVFLQQKHVNLHVSRQFTETTFKACK